MKYVVLICARNEETYIASCLSSLVFQTIQPELVVIVDDGSTDETAKRAHEFQKHLALVVVEKVDRGFSAIGTHLMADTYNAGLDILNDLEWDFLLILGADTAIPPEYVKTLYENMTCWQGVVSGKYSGIKETYAAATGRFIRREIIAELGGHLPRSNAWESSVNHFAQYLGFECRSYPVPIYNLRPPQTRSRSFVGRGRAIRELGYQVPNMLNKAYSAMKKGRHKEGIQIIWGYLIHKPQDPLPDWALYIGESQRQALSQKLRGLFK